MALRRHCLALTLACALAAALGPCGPIAGGRLSGEVVREPVSDWSFANEHERCQVEVRPAAPHSITANCFSSEGELFVGCMDCEGKRWSAYLVADAAARVKIAGRIHPVTAERIRDPQRIALLWRARAEKYAGGDEPDPDPVPDGYWLFQLRSR